MAQIVKINKKDWYTIPNILGYFRILLVPIFSYFLIRGQGNDYLIAAIVIAISGLSDSLDGIIARKFNQITELGKFLDPLADKLSLGMIILCLCFRFRLLIPVVVLYIIKESFMGIMGIVMIKHNGRRLNGAKWFGKVCTFLTYLVMLAIILLPSMDATIRICLIVIDGLWMLFTLIMYANEFRKMWKEEAE